MFCELEWKIAMWIEGLDLSMGQCGFLGSLLASVTGLLLDLLIGHPATIYTELGNLVNSE